MDTFVFKTSFRFLIVWVNKKPTMIDKWGLNIAQSDKNVLDTVSAGKSEPF
jgi:hypothetical protein